MSSRTRRLALVFGLAWGLGLAAASCVREPLALCGVIPEGGCPIGRGGTCDDPSCTGVYNCIEGQWTLEFACDGGGGGSGGSGASSSHVSTGACVTAVLDHSGEVAGCKPDLVDPDCPIAAAELCNPCSTGCIDFFKCTSAGWTDLAYCTEEGELVILR